MNSGTLELEDEAATGLFATVLAAHLKPGLLITLSGDLAAGKTALTRALLRALGHHGKVKSPTFTLVESYVLPDWTVHHFDLYRLASPAEVGGFGFEDYLAPDTVCVVEWPERGAGELPRADLGLQLEVLSPEARRVALSAGTDAGARILAALMRDARLNSRWQSMATPAPDSD
jgi:tRNA threonylcarbamoyladenosine biosynthesis protein TsaE